jgi:hypothetical protein
MVRLASAAAPHSDAACGLLLHLQLLRCHVFSAFGPHHVLQAFAFVPGFLTLSSLEMIDFISCAVYMISSTCQKKRPQKIHDSGRC